MLADEIKKIVFETDSDKDGTLKKKEISKRRKRVVSSLRQMTVSRNSAEEIWLYDNRDLLTSYLSGVRIGNLVISCFTQTVLRRVLAEETWEGNREEFQCLAESIASKNAFSDKETESLIPGIILLLAEKILRDDPSSYPYDFKLFHRLRNAPVSLYIKGYSPLEQILRFDPDGTYSKMDQATRNLYQKKIRNLAKRRKTSPEELASQILDQAKADQRHVGFYLPEKKNNVVYYPLIILLFIILSFVFLRSGGHIVLFAFSSLPLLYFSRNIVALVSLRL